MNSRRRVDFGPGPIGEQGLTFLQRLSMYIVYVLGCAFKGLHKFMSAVGVAFLVFLLALGLPRGMGDPTADLVVRAGLRDALSRYNAYRSATTEQFFPTKLPCGYNCRGYAWLGEARVETIWDTGSTRNSVDKAFLTALLENERTQAVVEDIVEIEPLTCSSM